MHIKRKETVHIQEDERKKVEKQISLKIKFQLIIEPISRLLRMINN